MKTASTQIQDDQQTISRMNTEENIPTHITIKSQKKKKKTVMKKLKAAREKKTCYIWGTRVKFSNDFSMKIMQVRK